MIINENCLLFYSNIAIFKANLVILNSFYNLNYHHPLNISSSMKIISFFLLKIDVAVHIKQCDLFSIIS